MASILSQHKVYFCLHKPLLFLWPLLSSSVSWLFLVYSVRSLPLIKTHGSESRDQEAACATTTVSYLHGWQL